MIEAKHSVGPWTAHFVGANGYVVQGGSPVQQIGVMFCKQDFVTTEQAKANAQLVRAAPDLLDVLKEIVGELEDGNDFEARQIARHAGRAAIAKATGEPL